MPTENNQAGLSVAIHEGWRPQELHILAKDSCPRDMPWIAVAARAQVPTPGEGHRVDTAATHTCRYADCNKQTEDLGFGA